MKDIPKNKENEDSLSGVIQKELFERRKIDIVSEVVSELLEKEKRDYIETLDCKHRKQMENIHKSSAELEEAVKIGDKELISNAFNKILKDATKK